MEKRLLTQAEFSSLTATPEGIGLVAIKFVGVGPNKQAELEHMPSKMCNYVEQQPTFYIISDSSDSIRDTLHQYVDRFCDARENKT